MNCDEARPLVEASVDRELSAGDELRLRAHLAGCPGCTRAGQAVEVLSRAMRASAEYHRAPAGLAQRIAAALPATAGTAGVLPVQVDGSGAARDASADGPGDVHDELDRRHAGAMAHKDRPPTPPDAAHDGQRPRTEGAPRATKPSRRAPFWWGLLPGSHGPSSAGSTPVPGAGWLAGALFGLCALAVGVVVGMHRPGADAAGGFVDELVASHIRAAVSGRDIDVISTDRHTVKPWFSGRIDYAPPVEDLAAQGFALAGGRLDYVGRERVAVLVYHYRKHMIDVYVFPPDSPAASLAAPPARDGYALERWQAGGMTWWAVTDAGPDALDAFRAALDARLKGGQSLEAPS